MLAQIRAITSETEVINVDIIESVAQDSLQTAAPVLKALRDNDIRVLARYEDIPKIDFEEIIKREIDKEGLAPHLDASNDRPGDYNGAEEPTSDTWHNVKNDVPSATDQSNQEVVTAPKSRSSSRKRGPATTRTPKGHLPAVIAELETRHHISPYEALKRAGFIRHSDEFLTV